MSPLQDEALRLFALKSQVLFADTTHMESPDIYTLTIRIPREQIEQAVEDADVTVTVEGVIERLAAMHEGNLHEDIKWAVQDIAEDPHDAAQIRPFRVEFMNDDPMSPGQFVVWVDDEGNQIERQGPFDGEDLAISAGITEGGRQVGESWPN